jgi:hypothetical protein
MPSSRPGGVPSLASRRFPFQRQQALRLGAALLALAGLGCHPPIPPNASAGLGRDASAGRDAGPGAADARDAAAIYPPSPPGLLPDAAPDTQAIPAAAVRIDPPGRTFVGTQEVRLSGGLPGTTIYYTLDGSVPTRASRAYSGPLTLNASTLLRAYADGPGGSPGRGDAGAGSSDRPVSAAAFVRVTEELVAWSSDLPVFVLHTHGSGKLPVVREGERLAGSVTVLDKTSGPGGRTFLVGTPTLVSRAGLRLRGESSLTFPQKSYSIELWEPGADQQRDSAMLDLPADSDFALVGPGYTDRTLMRNALAYAISNQIGRYAPRTRFAEVWVVEGGATLERADYRGVYTLAENIKRSASRVDVAKLSAADQRDPAITGGYSFRIDKGLNHFSVGPLAFQYVYPNWEEISLPAWTAQRTYLQGYVTEFLEAVAQPNLRHPRTGKPYSAYIDVPSFIDHNLMTVLFKNVDGLRLSAYFYKNRGGPVVAGPVWDFDRSSGTPHDGDFSRTSRALEAREWALGDGTHPLQWGYWAQLFADPEFKAAHLRRWNELSRAAFATDNLNRLIDRFAAELNESQARHFARWPDQPAAGGSHKAEVQLLKDWFAARLPWVTEQLSGAPATVP